MNIPTAMPPKTPGDTIKSSFHIAFCVDNHYFRAMGATITSIIENNPGMHFTFHVLTFGVSDDHRNRLQQLERKYDVSTQLHIIDPAMFKEFSHFVQFSYYSLSIFTRLVIPSVLRGITDKVLYLDADILCVGRLDELAQMDISDEIAIVVPDAEGTTRRRCAALKLKHPRYFNGGVLYINIDNWIENDITQQTMQALIQHGKKLRYNDQDALNIVLDGRAKFVAKKWNSLYDLIYDLDRGQRQMSPVGDAVFLHFAGAVKPWSDWSLHESRALFAKYHALSPWGDAPLDQAPRNYKEMRMFSRFLIKRGQVWDSLRWYFKYLKARPRT